jgi:predicted metal-dependent TIM-barrel fold hydrolase
MDFIDPHIHIASRTTDDLALMAKMGCRVVVEPAFWMGYDRTGVASFYDYYRQLTEWEPKRAAQVGIRHYCYLGVNSKEAENVAFAREVMAVLPEMLERPNVLGVGEIGLNKCTRNEATILVELVDLALRLDQMMVFHTPHLQDKYSGTRMILDILRGDRRVQPERVCIDHCEEHTIRLALDEGYWAGITLYPTTKANPERAVDMIEIHGADRVLVNSSADWGPSDPTAVPEFIAAMRRRGHSDSLTRKVVYDNPLAFLRSSCHFQFTPPA